MQIAARPLTGLARFCAAAIAALFAAVLSPAPASAQELSRQTLSGTFTRADHGRYRELRFAVPEGAARMTVSIEYERGTPWAAIDMALYDPSRFRGASGFWTTEFTLGEFEADPGYLAGPLPAGEWRLLLGGANAPEGRETLYTVVVAFLGAMADANGFARAPLRAEAGWYRGDFHAHTGHSDGTCASRSGARAPCPVVRTLEAAQERGLDFIAVSDHNTVSHFQSLRELQSHFDTLAIIPAQEVTTYYGHMNVFGAAAAIDFRLGTPSVPTFEAIARRVAALGGVLSINHPGISLTEGCPGCGWSTDIGAVRGPGAVEVVNGVVARYGEGPEGPANSLPFWMGLLNQGRRVTAIGGSDNHDPTDQFEGLSAVGAPTTVVYANALSAGAILDGLRAGHVFVDVEGGADRMLSVRAHSGAATAMMGDELSARRGEAIAFEIEVAAATGGRVEVLQDGAVLDISALDAPLRAHETRRFTLRGDGRRHWYGVNVRDAAGALILIGNPIYVAPPPRRGVVR